MIGLWQQSESFSYVHLENELRKFQQSRCTANKLTTIHDVMYCSSHFASVHVPIYCQLIGLVRLNLFVKKYLFLIK